MPIKLPISPTAPAMRAIHQVITLGAFNFILVSPLHSWQMVRFKSPLGPWSLSRGERTLGTVYSVTTHGPRARYGLFRVFFYQPLATDRLISRNRLCSLCPILSIRPIAAPRRKHRGHWPSSSSGHPQVPHPRWGCSLRLSSSPSFALRPYMVFSSAPLTYSVRDAVALPGVADDDIMPGVLQMLCAVSVCVLEKTDPGARRAPWSVCRR
jgi:hypothetical protein